MFKRDEPSDGIKRLSDSDEDEDAKPVPAKRARPENPTDVLLESVRDKV